MSGRRGRRRVDVDQLLRWGMVGVVLAIAAFAGIQSYTHIYELALSHGEGRLDARLLPLSVDGLILGASLVMLHEARNSRAVPGLARSMMWAGISATAAANLGFGLLANRAGGWPGMAIGAAASGWPAIAFVGAAEMALRLVGRQIPVSGSRELVSLRPDVPVSAAGAARTAYIASVKGGNPLSRRGLETRYGVTRTQAQAILDELAPSMNGSGPQ